VLRRRPEGMMGKSPFTGAFLALLLFLAPTRAPHTYRETHTGMTFVQIAPGEFEMGSPPSEPGHRPDEELHRVRLTHPFFMAVTEVTQRQWTSLMHRNPSALRNPAAPVEQVTWFEAQAFLRSLNALHEGTFRLPTEAEWEYACRAGTRTAYAFGPTLSTDDANYDGRYTLPGQSAGRYRAHTIAAGSLRANAWGLYDMHGNVWEWCEDDACDRPPHQYADPVGRCGSRLKVIRGGSWYFNADSARSALRYTHEPHMRGFSIGFRVVREVD